MDGYAKHASNIRDRVVKEFDKELSKPELNREKLKVVVDVFRNFEYLTSDKLRR